MLDAKLQKTDFSTIMAFDYGTQKMGVAAGQKITATGEPITLLPMRDGIPAWPELLDLIAQYQPEGILVGLPLNMDDSESELSQRARKFARRLRHQIQRPVWMVDERLTTRDARHLKSNTATHRSVDSIAAAMLIEQWYHHPIPIAP